MTAEAITAALEVSGRMTAGDLIVGIGTLALAAFTAWLAFRTSAEVAVSERQSELTQQSVEWARKGIEAQDRPFLVPEPSQGKVVEIYNGSVLFSLANHGKGVALLESVSLMTEDWPNHFEWPESGVKVIPAATSTPINQRLAGPELIEGDSCLFNIRYRTPTGIQWVTESSATVSRAGVLRFAGHDQHEAHRRR